MPVRTRLALLVAVAAAVLMALGGWVFVARLHQGLTQAVDANLRYRADALSQQIGPDGTGFQDAGADHLLPPNQALTQVIGSHGTLVDASDGTSGKPLIGAARLDQARHGPVSVTVEWAGQPIRVLAVPVADTGHPPVVVLVATSAALIRHAVDQAVAAMAVGGAVVVILAGAGAWVLAGAALRPVERMRRQADRITAGQPDAKLTVPGSRDEVARLGATMNDLLDRLQHALAQQREFVADAGHELRTPLAYLRGELELAARPGRSAADLRAAVLRAAGDTDRLIRLAEDLLVLARADRPIPAMVTVDIRLDHVVQAAAAAARSRADAAGVLLDTSGLASITASADPDRIRQIVDNLLDNAIRYAPAGTSISLSTHALADPDRAAIDVRDHGPGFPPDFLPYTFERFRRADSARTDPGRSRDAAGTARAAGSGGAGLGLAVVAALTDAHGGTATASNTEDGGALVRVTVPTATPEPDDVDGPLDSQSFGG